MKQLEDGRQEEAAEEGEVAPRAAGGELLIKRERLIHELDAHGGEGGATFVCAPDGFGKTALLLQYVAAVREDPARGAARVIDASTMDADALGRALQTCGDELDPKMRPVVAVDGLPPMEEDVMDQLAALVRALCEHGFRIVIACRPDGRAFMAKLGDSTKVGAQSLAVHPQEYAEWARAFRISNSLDVYRLTQGVPSLVSLLQTVTGARGGHERLGQGVADLYRAALEPLRRARDPLYRLACFFILLGEGSITDFERSNMRVRAELLQRVQHDYPIFGYRAETRTFSCMGADSEAMGALRREIAKRSSSFAPKAVRMLLRADRVDDAVSLAEELLGAEAALEVIAQFPEKFALSGNGSYVHAVVSRMSGEDLARAPVGVVLSVYLSALTMGEYRLAKAMCSTLQRRAYVIEANMDTGSWQIARAMSEVWKGCPGVELPMLSEAYERRPVKGPASLLHEHQRIYGTLIGGSGDLPAERHPVVDAEGADEGIDVPGLLLMCDQLLDDALHGTVADPVATDQRLQRLVSELSARRLTPLAARVRMTAATCRIMSGLPVVDERAFTDAGTIAVRESDFPTQLFCFLGEGWQAMAVNQFVNAQFRAQQVIKLADPSQTFLQSWASILGRTAYLLNTSKVAIVEEAELIDVSETGVSSARAWEVALHLSTARFDSELSAWYSLHRDVLLDERFCPLARLAMSTLGERADPIRRLLPRRLGKRYLLGDESAQPKVQLFEVPGRPTFSAVGQVGINLFGGFHVERNGHTITDDVWRRRKTSVLAARLALSMGSFVSRRVLTEELWPDLEYSRARENLYVTASTLRSALGQQTGGPQYLITQGDGLSLNSEFISSDVGSFDLLAREILLKRNGIAGRQVIEACLKMEELYVGPLYVPDSGDSSYFLRMRRVYLSKFVDCMLRGIDVAIDEDDVHSATWMAESALRHVPAREDVVRSAMRVFDLAGRRREVVELYNSHLYYLEHELHAAPDNETRRIYEEIMGTGLKAAMM